MAQVSEVVCGLVPGLVEQLIAAHPGRVELVPFGGLPLA